jgi:hypothetical protein
LLCGDKSGNLYQFLDYKKGGDGTRSDANLIKGGLGGITAITYAKKLDKEYIIVAVKDGCQVRSYDTSGNLEKKYPKVSNPPISSLKILYSGVFLMSEQERNVSMVFDEENVLSLIALAKPVFVDLNQYRNTKNSYHVLCLDSNGTVNLWTVSRKKKSSGSKGPNGKITIDTDVISATFESENRIVIAYGKTVNPKFHVVTYFDNGIIIQNIELKADKENDTFIEFKPTTTKEKKSTHTVLGPSDMTIPNIKMSGVELKKNTDEELASFGSLLESAEGIKADQPKVESVKSALIQAIKTDDNEQLSSIFNNTQMSIIQKTVAGIPTNYVIPLLKYIISKFRSNPKFGLNLINWMKVVLIEHTSYLMTVPELVKILAELYTTIDSRVSVLDDLLKLQGRMDLLLSQINNKRDRQTFDTESVPISVYNEADDEPDDDVDGVMEIDDGNNNKDNDESSNDEMVQ